MRRSHEASLLVAEACFYYLWVHRIADNSKGNEIMFITLFVIYIHKEFEKVGWRLCILTFYYEVAGVILMWFCINSKFEEFSKLVALSASIRRSQFTNGVACFHYLSFSSTKFQIILREIKNVCILYCLCRPTVSGG